ncbi:hypothetical protein M0805_000011 [Coniferiporia weirii]|nr:hypothetical protein M0805_000011 [Coniferiporia weirii]
MDIYIFSPPVFLARYKYSIPSPLTKAPKDCSDKANMSQRDSLDLYSSLEAIRWTKMCNASAATLLLYDFVTTYDREVNLMWGAKFNIGKVIYFTIRYFTFFSVFFILIADKKTGISWIRFNWMSGVIIGILAELTLQLRVYAMYNRSKKMLLFLIVLFTGTFSAMYAISVKIMLKEKGFYFDFLDDFYICTPYSLPNFYAEVWVPMLVHEAILFGLAIYKGLQSFRSRNSENPSSRLTLFLVKDSAMYFVIVFATFIANELVWVFGKETLIEVPVSFAFTMGSIMSQRLLLNVREQYFIHATESFDATKAVIPRSLELVAVGYEPEDIMLTTFSE